MAKKNFTADGTRKILLLTGIFLVLDGVLSIYFGHKCLNSCTNNNLFGDFVRIIRALVGGYLIYLGR